jgi:hypothetical protein
MSSSPKVADRLRDLIGWRNRELAFDALLKTGLGVGFSCVTFGMLFWFGWVLGFFFGRHLNLHPWQIGAIFSGLFLVVATWSAWRRIDPLANLAPLSDREWFLTMLSQAAGGLGYFSPRHASAGLAIVLIGGPAAVIEAFGIWAHRIRADAVLIEESARTLVGCEPRLPITQVHNLAAAFLLNRLALIKVVPDGHSRVLKLTDKGFAVLSKGKAGKGKRKSDHGGSRRERGRESI